MALHRLSFLSVQFGLILAFTTLLSGQLNRGTIEGTVTDPQEAALRGVDVSITSVDTNVVTSTKTNSAGYYRADALVPGTYRVHFVAKGFATLDMTTIEVPAAQDIRVDAKLKVGSINERLEVKAELPMLETAASNFSSTLQPDVIQNVPLAGRDLQQLTFLLPGINNVGGPPGSNFGFDSSFGTFPDPTHLLGSAIAVNGGQGGANAWYLDGNLNISSFGENVVINPSPDSVSEFQAITNAFSAEYSHTGGAVFSTVLKSGTNNFHGNVYEYLRNSAINASNPFSSQAGFGKNVVQFNNFGSTLGGPVIIPHVYDGRNKTFFFFSLDATILHQSGNNAYTVPTALMRQGDFSEDPNVVSNGIWDPLTTMGPQPDGTFQRTAFGTPAPGNPFGAQGCLNSSVEAGAAMTPPVTTCNFSTTIPTDRLDPTAMFFINSFPLPNHIDTLGGCPLAASGTYSVCNNFEGKAGSSQDPINLSIKIDHQTGKGKYFFEWLFSPTQYRNYAVPWTGPTFPQELVGFGSNYNFDIRSQIFALGHTYAFNPQLINEFRASFTRQFLTTLKHPYPDSFTSQSTVEQQLAPTLLPTNPFFPTPNIHLDSTPGGGYMYFGPTPWVNIATGTEAFTILDNVTKIIGKHTLKTGFMYRLNHASYKSGFPTTLEFDGSLTTDPSTFVGGNGLAQFMLGAVPGDGSGFAGSMQPPYLRWRNWGFYFQDDFHVRPNFTWNLGLRYDLNGYFKTRYHPMGNFCFTCLNPLTGLNGQNIYEGDPGFPKGDILPANHTDFAPRFNFSWSPFANRKTVIRGGYDIFYSDAIENVNAPGQSAANGNAWNQSGSWSRAGSIDSQCNAFNIYGACVAFLLGDTTTNKTSLMFPSITGPFPAETRANFLGRTFAFIKPNRDPMVQSYTLEIQQELPAKVAVSVAYVGTHGSHLAGSGYGNWFNYVSTKNALKYQAQLFNNYPITDFFSGQTATQLGILYGDPVNGPASELPLTILLLPYPFFPQVPSNGTYSGTSTYNGMNLKVEKRYSHGLDFIAAYTVSKQMDNWSVGMAGVQAVDPIHYTRTGLTGGRGGQLVSAYGGPLTFQDPDNRNVARAIAVDDIPQQFNISATYELPIGRGKALLGRGGRLGSILGGWKLSGNFNAQKGLPLPITCPGSELQITQFPNPGVVDTTRGGLCNLIGDPHFSGHRSKSQQIADWINPGAFEPAFGNDVSYNETDPQAWTFGNMKPRTDAIRGPGFWNLDSSLMKDFHFTEARYVEFRWEVFNALNHQNLALPNTTFCLPPNPDGSVDLVHQDGCTFGKITGVQTDPRNMTFALKFVW
jgi:carboxypeptidase family protein